MTAKGHSEMSQSYTDSVMAVDHFYSKDCVASNQAMTGNFVWAGLHNIKIIFWSI
jgi:hypothetical protein